MGESNKTNTVCAVRNTDNQHQKILLKSPELYIVDAGCWLKSYNYFVAISGSSIVIGRVLTKIHLLTDMQSSILTRSLDKYFNLEQYHGKLDGATEKVKELFRSQDVLEIDTKSSDPLYQKSEIWIEPIASVKLEALNLDEIKIKDRLFCNSEELYIFIPDMHICLGKEDPCDFFRHEIDNTLTLSWFTRRVKQLAGTIVQTGDMFDFWMAEAESSIYFNKELSLERDELTPRDNAARIAESARRLDRSLGTDKIVEILFNIDQYILGNHDWEMNFPAARNHLAGKVQNSKIHAETHPLHIDRTAISVTHGHFFESYNDTSFVENTDANAFMKVYGKSITMDYARGVRGTPYFLPREQSDQYTLSSSWKFLMSKAGRVLSDCNGLLDAATDLTQFNDMRHGALLFLMNSLAQKNPKYFFQLDSPSVIAFFDPNRTIYWYSENGADAPPCITNKVLVHSHSHIPFITKITLVYDKDLPAKQRTITDVVKSIQNPDPNENPLMPPQLFMK